ncbi:hypothetical protein ABEB36_015789 [Hypothenemus hampei]|uniref:Uncharacterized protein n=1 Tax=Hypothenemus hampei TaxID=57062 RepID=A0ABD1DYS0_HYPHA
MTVELSLASEGSPYGEIVLIRRVGYARGWSGLTLQGSCPVVNPEEAIREVMMVSPIVSSNCLGQPRDEIPHQVCAPVRHEKETKLLPPRLVSREEFSLTGGIPGSGIRPGMIEMIFILQHFIRSSWDVNIKTTNVGLFRLKEYHGVGGRLERSRMP